MRDRPLIELPDGEVDEMDRVFDRVYPPRIQRLSRTYWTPVAVAKRAAELLDCAFGDQVLDVGAGVGKFCVVGALATSATFVGVEKHQHLVQLGQSVVQENRVPRVELIHGDAFALDWSHFEGIYFYNPFVGSSPNDFAIRRTQMKLWEVRLGARVATYHGFGGEMPSGYQLVTREPIGTDHIEVWQRTNPQEAA